MFFPHVSHISIAIGTMADNRILGVGLRTMGSLRSGKPVALKAPHHISRETSQRMSERRLETPFVGTPVTRPAGQPHERNCRVSVAWEVHPSPLLYLALGDGTNQ